MSAGQEPSLSLAEWLVLCLVCEQPAHGFALAALLGPNGDLGRVWRVPKPVVYRALQRLDQVGLVQISEQEPSHHGPARCPVRPTGEGRNLAAEWLNKPVGHNRDVRSELLVKLALLARRDVDPRPLLRAQRDQLMPVAHALAGHLAQARGFDHTIALWRCETMSATLRFLDALAAQHAAAAPAAP